MKRVTLYSKLLAIICAKKVRNDAITKFKTFMNLLFKHLYNFQSHECYTKKLHDNFYDICEYLCKKKKKNKFEDGMLFVI